MVRNVIQSKKDGWLKVAVSAHLPFCHRQIGVIDDVIMIISRVYQLIIFNVGCVDIACIVAVVATNMCIPVYLMFMTAVCGVGAAC